MPRASDSPTPDEIRSELARVLSGSLFVNAHRLSRFLRFIVESFLAGERHRLKEQVLGREVFERSGEFDPAIDSIVRVEVTRLRSKLHRYFRTEGVNDPITISLKKGGYLPAFRRRREAKSQRNIRVRTPAVAVLPFHNLSGDPQQDFLCEGIAEELIHALSRVSDLRVIAWNSTRKLKGAVYDIRSVTRQLNAGTVVEGSIRNMGGRLRIAVQLVETADYCCLWSEVLECDDAGVGLVRETISQAIIAALTTSLVGQATPRLSPRQTESPEFHNLYLKGRYHLNRRTAEGLRRAIGYFTQLIACSPRYARAHAGLAEALVLLTWYGHAAPNHAMPKAKASALRAVQEDTRLAEAHLALGLVSQLFDWDWARARQSLQLALELSPGSATALFEFGFFLSRMGDLDEAFATMRRAQELDPLSPLINTNLGVNYYYQRNYNQAVRQFEDALELDPGYQPAHYRLAMAYLQMARVNDAIACLEKGLRLPGASPLVLALSGCAMARSGRKDRALEIRDALLASSGDHYISPVSIAILCMGMNENRQALDWLAHGWEEHDMLLVDLKIDPLFDPLRGQPGFRKLLAGMNLSRSTASC